MKYKHSGNGPGNGRRGSALKAAALLLLALTVSAAGCSTGLPRIDSLDSLSLVEATQVFDVNGKLIAKLFEEHRIVITLNNMSEHVPQAIIANEDSRFYQHMGIDPIGIARAALVNLRQGGIVEGGSTITQQLAKEMFLNQERTLTRKIKEAVLALALERRFSKQEILQAYLNQVYFGEGAYGVEAASLVYFGKRAAELTLAESAMLAGLPRGPNIYSPYVDIRAAESRRATVLAGMAAHGYITREQASQAGAEPVMLAGKKKRPVQASYFIDYVANELVGRYGANRVYKGGLKIYTTLDIDAQQAAEEILGKNQGAVIALDPRNGHIRAMVGGRDYAESQVNRVFSEVRQPGSAFKPFLYTVALNKGLTAASVIVDEPVNIGGYSPQNYDKKFRGPVTMKKALRWSVNIAAVKVGRQVGMEDVLTLARSLGMRTIVPEDNNLASALGGLTQGVNLIELTAAYTPFANAGIFSRPVAILKVLDDTGQVLENGQTSQTAVLRPEVAYIMTDMLRGVLVDGTGTPGNIGRPAAGKTGTTDNYETAWFVGYTPDLLAGVYVGNDDRKPVPISGTEVAGLWGKMMVKALAKAPPQDFPVPPNVTAGVPVCADSGRLALAGGCTEREWSAFIKGTEPVAADTRSRFPTPAAPGTTDGARDKPRWRLPFRLPGL